MEQQPQTKAHVVSSLMGVKRRSGKTFTQIGLETGLTNVYVAQLLRRQAQLKPDTAAKLRAALPELTDLHVFQMMESPLRSYDPSILQDPTVYRLNEAVMHFGESIKEIINEEFGDGMFGTAEHFNHLAYLLPGLICKGLPRMSAIDFFCSVDKVKGVDGKDRVVLTFDGKYLPHTEHKVEHMVSRLKLRDD